MTQPPHLTTESVDTSIIELTSHSHVPHSLSTVKKMGLRFFQFVLLCKAFTGKIILQINNIYVKMDNRFFGYRMAKSCDSGFAVV